MKSVEELIALRGEAFDEIRRQQIRIATIDAVLTTDPRYEKSIEEWEGDFATVFPDVQVLGEENPREIFN